VSNLNTPGAHVLVDTETKASRRLIDKRQLIYIFEHERLDFYFRPSYLLTDCMNEKSLHRLSRKSPEKYAARVGHCEFVKTLGKNGTEKRRDIRPLLHAFSHERCQRKIFHGERIFSRHYALTQHRRPVTSNSWNENDRPMTVA